jgi:hypothetical protein
LPRSHSNRNTPRCTSSIRIRSSSSSSLGRRAQPCRAPARGPGHRRRCGGCPGQPGASQEGWLHQRRRQWPGTCTNRPLQLQQLRRPHRRFPLQQQGSLPWPGRAHPI